MKAFKHLQEDAEGQTRKNKCQAGKIFDLAEGLY